MDPLVFGQGELALDATKSVFINCPFDAEYATLFDAIVFATVCCGFMPRCAIESGTVSEPRVARIVRALAASKYSIHDLSRCTGEGTENIARFNMPLELGMAMARKFIDPAREHDWLLLVPSGHAYGRFVSDLAAYDPVSHDGSVPSVVIAVMSWLATRPDAVPTATPREVLALLPTFQNQRNALNEAWGDCLRGLTSFCSLSRSQKSSLNSFTSGRFAVNWTYKRAPTHWEFLLEACTVRRRAALS